MESKIPAVEVKLGFKWQGLLIAVIVGLGIWLIPTPEGLSAKAWGMLALFVATIVAIIAKAMPMGAATLVASSTKGKCVVPVHVFSYKKAFTINLSRH